MRSGLNGWSRSASSTSGPGSSTVKLDTATDPQLDWLYHVGPVGLVVGPNILREEDLTPARQTAVDSGEVANLLNPDPEGPALLDPWAFFAQVLGWEARYVAGAPGGADLAAELSVYIPEHDITLSPDWAVRDLGAQGPQTSQVLVQLFTGLEADRKGALAGWEATPHQRFERLLRETGVSIGILLDREHLRLVYAPRGETSGWLSFPLRSLSSVAGRAMLGGLKLLLGRARLFTEPEARRLPMLLARSREAQGRVSAELAEQVLGALHELLRAFHAADPERIEQLATSRPQHLYEGLLGTLMRLVFLLYAEDRDLLPTERSGAAVEIYEQGYSVRGLYARLAEDRALHPDTMDERVGAWGRLLALFRLVHRGHPSGWITARGGKLFNPGSFPFLEGRDQDDPTTAAQVLPLRDGAILRILEGLMTIEARTLGGERVRERLSYRSLDVEQIGSVYETIMGFTVLRATGPMLAVKGAKGLPVFVDIETLAERKGTERQKLLKEWGVAPTGKRLEAVRKAADAAALTEALSAFADERGSPGGHLTPEGAPYLQPTDERRRSGSHYTPRALTEPIVRHALEPAFERLGEAATPDQVLEIKVCDPACGSGAFLVEACRQLGERLEKAWAHHPDLKPPIPADEDEALHARRLVAQRSLYGVDRNPLAVDLARLSLWLATLAREHEFTFLDHALKAGDSLVGLTQAQIQAVNWNSSKPSMALLRILLRERMNEALTGRREIQFAPDDVTRAMQEARHHIVERKLDQPRVYGDAIIAAFFSAEKPKAREEARQEIESLILGGSRPEQYEKLSTLADALRLGNHPIRPFHWELEFPEVFLRDNSGFDAIVGNPPFAGKNTIIVSNRSGYLDWLKALHEGAHGNADLVAHFFRRSFSLLRQDGCFGLIATNTIGQGDTRATGLAAILASAGTISQAVKRLQWPGVAAVIVSVVHVTKAAAHAPLLDGRRVSRISAYLVEGDTDVAPVQLAANARKAFIGSYLLGMGFTFDDVAAAKGETENLDTMRALIEKDPRNAERIFPYIGGEEVNTSPTHAYHRLAIDFGTLPQRRAQLPAWLDAHEDQRNKWLDDGIVPIDYPDPVAADWPSLLTIVEQRVKPAREALGNNPDARRRKKFWWRYGRAPRGLYTAISNQRKVLALSRVSPQLGIARLPDGMVYAESLVVFAFSGFAPFATLQSRIHEIWARFFSSTLEDRLRYAPSDCFETFPFPPDFDVDPSLEAAGRGYHDHRAALMVARNEGMTKTYNRFHDVTETAADIRSLRELHAEMDRTVLRAYGWDDLAERAEPRFLDETNEDDHTYQGRLFWPSGFRDEVLARLLALNGERHAEETRLGLAKPASVTVAEGAEVEGKLEEA